MLRKYNLFIFSVIGLGVAYVILSLLVLFTRGRFPQLLRKKITVGLMIITFSSIIGTGNFMYSQEATDSPLPTVVYGTSPPVYGTTPPDLTIGPTDEPTATPAPTDTPAPTAIPTTTPDSVTTVEPTAEPMVTMPVYGIATIEPTSEPAETPVILPVYGIMTAEPSEGPSVCTCVAKCDLIATIAPDFAQDGAGEYCWETSSLGIYINSWNVDVLQINGVDYTNTYVLSSSIQSEGGKYYVYYKASYSWSHFEMKN